MDDTRMLLTMLLISSLMKHSIQRIFSELDVEPAFQLAGYLTSMARRDTLPGRLCSSFSQSLVQEATTLSYLDTTVSQAQGLHH